MGLVCWHCGVELKKGKHLTSYFTGVIYCQNLSECNARERASAQAFLVPALHHDEAA